MASRQKQNGCTARRRLEEAMKKLGCDPRQFFEKLGRAPGVVKPENFDAHLEAARFEHFQAKGTCEDPHYRIPECALEFAASVIAAKCPHALMRVPAPPVMMRRPASASVAYA